VTAFGIGVFVGLCVGIALIGLLAVAVERHEAYQRNREDVCDDV
jgi:hypothetical protein